MTISQSVSTHAVYQLGSLGWKAFQQLCTTIVGDIWGHSVQSFADSADGGRDGAFSGQWKDRDSNAFTGSFTVQCKFSAKSAALKLGNLKDELDKVRRLASKNLCDNYFIFSNGSLSGPEDEKIRAAFEAVPGVRKCVVIGQERISEIIRESARLRMLVPRIYGIGDLSTILDERAATQAKEILSYLGQDLQKFVVTDAYRRAAKALVEHGFVMLLGEPACGKSAIAAALAVGSLDEWGCSTFKVSSAAGLTAHWNPDDKRQFFWVDDAFGATQFDWIAASEWNQAFPHLQAAIRNGAKIVFTSRDYIYRNAQYVLKESALPVIKQAQVVINVERLGDDERRQILYNHIRLGTQSKEFKRDIKPFLDSVATNRRFGPEIARRLGNPAFTGQLSIGTTSLARFVENPMGFLKEVIQTIDVNSKAAIAVVFMHGGSVPSPVSLRAEDVEAIQLLGGDVAGVRRALTALDGSMLLQVQENGQAVWRFKHPTIRDAFASIVSEDRELMDIYLAGSPVLTLFSEISCGDIGMEGVKVIVPDNRFDKLVMRIAEFCELRRDNVDSVHRFLARRCNSKFLSRYMELVPAFLPSLTMKSYVESSTDVSLAAVLVSFQLMPESDRLKHSERLRELAVSTPDGGVFKHNIRQILTASELQQLRKDVRLTLIPDLEKLIEERRDEFDGSWDPESHFDSLDTTLRHWRDEFSSDTAATIEIEAAIRRVTEVVEELKGDDNTSDDSDLGESGRPLSDSERSVFEDVDQ